MKFLFLTFIFSLISSANAGTISFVGACSKEPIAVFDFDINEASEKSVGQITIDTLIEQSIPFLGTDEGINSIFNTPVGIDAMEIPSDTEMMAYGWCYSINGFEPNAYPHKIFATNDDHILWWFGFAHNKDGKWISQCTPSYTRRAAQFCEK